MRITLDGREIELSRPVLRVAVQFAAAIQHILPDDAEQDEDGNISADEIPAEYVTVAAAALGTCLPRSEGAPVHRGSLRPERLIAYGDEVDRWAFAQVSDMEAWATTCLDVLAYVLQSIPNRDRQEEAADPTEAHTAAPSPA